MITIIGILIALLLPAVQAAREAARRLQCSSNLKQLGMAIHNYSAAFNVLPVNISPYSKDCDANQLVGTANGKGWIVSILPQLEQQGLFDQFLANHGFEGDCGSGQGITRKACVQAMATRLSVLECSSDPSVQKVALSTLGVFWFTQPVAQTSYKGVLGDNIISKATFVGSANCINMATAGAPCTGTVFRCNYRTPRRFADFTDGTSNTFMLGESVAEYDATTAAYYANGDQASCSPPLNYWPEPPTPNDWWSSEGFRSRHPGGAQFCLADGSVAFVSEKIDHDLYRALGTIAAKLVTANPNPREMTAQVP